MRSLVFASTILIAFAGCGGGSTTPPGDDAPDAPPISGDHFTLTWGPVSVPPGVEDTRCVTLRLPNPTPLKIHSMHNTLGTMSHHFIVYRDNDPADQESPTPTPCQPFVGTLNPGGMVSPMMITQRDDEVLTLPDGVAYSFDANQLIRLEMHFINTGDVETDVIATAEFYPVPDSEIQNEADFLFIGSPDIDYTLQPSESATLQAYFPMPASLNGSNIFAITGHTHKLGTDMNVSTAPSAAGTRTEIYNPTPFSWSEPETRRHDPPIQVAPGGGFDFECTWTNDGASATSFSFGESANDEMCFFWAYYYPSQGAKVCIHTDQTGGSGLNACCPDPANVALCNFIASQL